MSSLGDEIRRTVKQVKRAAKAAGSAEHPVNVNVASRTNTVVARNIASSDTTEAASSSQQVRVRQQGSAQSAEWTTTTQSSEHDRTEEGGR